MSATATAIFTLAGVFLGALLSWLLGYFLEIHKAKILRDQTRFVAYHAKQVEVLAEIYKQLSQVVSTIEDMMKLMPPGDNRYPKDVLREFINGSSPIFNKLNDQFSKYRSYYRANAVYLDDDFEEELKIINNKIFQLVTVRQVHSTWINNDDQMNTPYNKQLKFSANQIYALMPRIKNRVRKIIIG